MKTAAIANQSTAEARRKALNALQSFMGASTLTFPMFSESLMAEWAVWLTMNGYTQKTAAHYLKQIITLYNSAVDDELALPSDAVSKTRSRLLAFPEEAFAAIDPQTFGKLQAFFRAKEPANPALRLAMDVAAFAILNGGMDFDAVATLRKDDYTGDNHRLKRIVERYAKPKNKYLFPLDQSRRTPAQLRTALSRMFYAALSPYGIMPSRREESTAADLWWLAAWRCGVAPAKIMGATARRAPSFNPVPSLLAPESVTPEERERLLAMVAAAVEENPLQWYAMQFRPYVNYEKVKRGMELCKSEASFAEIYYPCCEIAKRVGRKITSDSRPVMPGLLFFKSRVGDIAPMFRNIGHLAWCYRRGADKGSPYAVISRQEMQAYQTAIGQFTADMEVLPEGTIEIKENDRVVLLGGAFAGKSATVAEIKGLTPGKTIYRLTFIGANGIEWAVDTDPRLVRKEI